MFQQERKPVQMLMFYLEPRPDRKLIADQDHLAAQKRSLSPASMLAQSPTHQKQAYRKRCFLQELMADRRETVSDRALRIHRTPTRSARDSMVARKPRWSGQDSKPDRKPVVRILVLMMPVQRPSLELMIPRRMGWRRLLRMDLSWDLIDQLP